MEAREYEKMAEVEDRMWWYRGLHRNLLAVLDRYLSPRATRLLDAGCGTGGLLRVLGSHDGSRKTFGLDAWQPACAFATSRSRRPVVQGVITCLPIADDSVDCLVSADVLCHESVEPMVALRELRRCLRADGLLVLNLPAYQWMFSYHDVRVKTARRFNRAQVMRLLEDAGFAPLYASYWNTFLFPVMALRRMMPGSDDQESDVHLYPPAVEAFFGGLVACESVLVRAGLRLPFGGSVLAVARRRDA
jgi:SAM-dependent methyltransferase